MTMALRGLLDVTGVAMTAASAALAVAGKMLAASVTGVVGAGIMLMSVLSALFEDKARREELEQSRRELAAFNTRMDRFADTMAAMGFDIEKGRKLLDVCPADFDGGPPRVFIKNHDYTRSELEPPPPMASQTHYTADLSERDMQTAVLRKRVVSDLARSGALVPADR